MACAELTFPTGWAFVLAFLVLIVANLCEAQYRFSDQDLKRYEGGRVNRGMAESSPNESSPAAPPSQPGPEKKLKRYTIPYQGFEGSARRIIIPVRFNGRLSAPMALDTGAPGMILSVNLARKLGLLDATEDHLAILAGGIGGTAPAILTIVDSVEVGAARDEFVPTQIVPLRSNAFEGLVGMEFMANYTIEIDTLKHRLVFEERPPGAQRPGGHDAHWWQTNFQRFAQMRTGWREYRKYLEGLRGNTIISESYLEFADGQYRAADRIFGKLNRYAVDHYVPMEWRRY